MRQAHTEKHSRTHTNAQTTCQPSAGPLKVKINGTPVGINGGLPLSAGVPDKETHKYTVLQGLGGFLLVLAGIIIYRRYATGETELDREIRRQKEAQEDDERGRILQNDFASLVEGVAQAPSDSNASWWQKLQRYNVDIRPTAKNAPPADNKDEATGADPATR